MALSLSQIAALEASLAAAQKTIDEAPASVAEEVKDDAEIASLREALSSTQAELEALKATLPKADELAGLREQLSTKEAELAGAHERLERDVEKSQNEVDTVREILDNERKTWGDQEEQLKATLCVTAPPRPRPVECRRLTPLPCRSAAPPSTASTTAFRPSLRRSRTRRPAPSRRSPPSSSRSPSWRPRSTARRPRLGRCRRRTRPRKRSSPCVNLSCTQPD